MEGGGGGGGTSRKFGRGVRPASQNPYTIDDQKSVIFSTLFMNKTAEKPIPFEAAHTYMAHIREYPPGDKHAKNQVGQYPVILA